MTQLILSLALLITTTHRVYNAMLMCNLLVMLQSLYCEDIVCQRDMLALIFFRELVNQRPMTGNVGPALVCLLVLALQTPANGTISSRMPLIV